MANSSEDLDDLKSIMEGYCHDFDMNISPGKTHIIQEVEDWVWLLLDLNEGEVTELEMVEQYKYLGIRQKWQLGRR